MQRTPFSPALERLVASTIDVACGLHRDLGPGLLESVYERMLVIAPEQRGIAFERQVPVDFSYFGVRCPGGLRVDVLVARQLVIEVKAVEQLSALAVRQTLTYLRLTGLPIGLVISFGGVRFSDAVRRVENHRTAVPRGIERMPMRARETGTARREDEPFNKPAPYISRRAWSACAIVTPSAYSRSPPTGRPRAMRVTRTPRGASWRWT